MAMNTTMSLREAVYTFAMQLPPEERLAVGEDIIQSVTVEQEDIQPSESFEPELNQAERILAVMESWGDNLAGWDAPEFDDAVAWVKNQREAEAKRYAHLWDEET